MAGGEAERVTDLGADIAGYAIAPTGDRLAIWGDRDLLCTDFECEDVPAAPEGQGSARVYDESFVRHWDAWVQPGVRSRVFTLPMVDGRPQGAATPVAPGLVGDSPSKPFGGGEEIAWSNDGRTLYFALRLGGRTEPNSTNLDIYAAREGAAPVNLTEANRALDTGPAVSPDGRWLAYTAMARPGYEADRQVIQLRNLASGESRALTADWDRSVGSLAWAADGRSLFVTAGEVLDTPLFQVDIRTGRATRLTEGGTVGNVTPLAGGAVLYTLNSLRAPDDLYLRDARGQVRQLTRVNVDRLQGLDPVAVERFSFPGANGDTVWGQIVKPAGASGRLPVALLIHGGPQGSFGNGWSYRWNPWLFAAPGYAAVTIDFHGSTGYGQAFTDAINRTGGAPSRICASASPPRPRGCSTRHRQCLRARGSMGIYGHWIAGRGPRASAA